MARIDYCDKKRGMKGAISTEEEASRAYDTIY